MSTTYANTTLSESAKPSKPRKISRQLTGSSSRITNSPKKPRLDISAVTPTRPPAPRANTPRKDRGVGVGDNGRIATPSKADIWKWTLRKDAIAKCFVKDALEMRENSPHDTDFFWLGRVPCRTVQFVGMLVGVLVQEKRIVYTLDDGTAVIDCIHKHQFAASSPVKQTSSRYPRPAISRRPQGTSSPTKPVGYASACASPHKSVLASPAGPVAGPSKSTLATEPPGLKPVAWVGAVVKVTGRVIKRFEDRIAMVDEIEQCPTVNDEPSHWLAVLELHHNVYFNDTLGPFVIPSPPPRPAQPIGQGARARNAAATQDTTTVSVTAVGDNTTTAFTSTVFEPQTPSASSAYSADSPSRLSNTQSPHPRLRHPARIHSRELSANTFRIYLNNYMLRAPPPRRSHTRVLSRSPRSRQRSVSPTPLPRNSQLTNTALPTLGLSAPASSARSATAASGRRSTRVVSEETPRAMKTWSMEQTPRAASSSFSLPALTSLGDTDVEESGEEEEGDEDGDMMYGFTLSHLRRVPELALLARRVVDAEARRRIREERERERNSKKESRGLDSKPSISRDKAKGKGKAVDPPEPRGRKIKRLFRFALRQLYDEGAIVLWDGPVHRMPLPEETAALWRSAEGSTSSRSSRRPIPEEEEGDVPSDAPPGEESYVPLTPQYLLSILEGLIDAHIADAARRLDGKRSKTTLEALVDPQGPPPGPTAEELLRSLKRDERWARVGSWAVETALKDGEEAGRVWNVGKGSWERCV
ncbi:hypothetical protein CERSUDRAFT_96660 [Gelatoporia subvermispora B]|uniref:CST complex subunit Stn1 N-terminal domain-containing protein n=1 Tax=Ceriporiopsis subvermispora (strain B) TaxID=914234 RepID=M2RAV5_CERS8|nr:hypothetical protein CERSUDRAFT_96660 [Gelatoporia subvermispora B]